MKEATSEPGRVYVKSFCLNQNWQKEKYLQKATEFASFTRPAEVYFFQAIIHFAIFRATVLAFRSCLAQNTMVPMVAAMSIFWASLELNFIRKTFS